MIGGLFSHTPYDALAALVPASLLLTATLEIAIFALLLQPEGADDTRGRLVLALTFLGAGLFSLVRLLVVPPFSHVPPLVSAGAGAGPWFYAQAHLYVGIGAFVYARTRADRRASDAAFRVRVCAGAGFFLAFACLLAATGAPRLGAVVNGSAFVGPVAAAGAALGALACFAGFVRLVRLRAIAPIERAFALTVLTMTADIVLAYLSGSRYTVGWSIAHFLLLFGPCFVFAAVARRLMRAHAALRNAENALAQSARRAARIRLLWQVATSDALSDEEHGQAVLDAGCAALRTGHPLFGMISHMENDEIVIDAISWTGYRETHAAALALFQPGARFPIGTTVALELTADARTRHWNDIESGGAPSALIAAAGWRNVIAAAFQTGRTTFLLAFGTGELLAEEPFAEDDAAFVDVLASQLSHRYYEREQLSRIRYQMEHDALTGLRNRTEFRKALRENVGEGKPFAVALLDLDGFRYINETSGHLIGDEILVEIAATLKSVHDDDLVARLGGDDFGIIMGGTHTDGIVAGKLARYAAAFERPFHTGDREGKHFLPVSASIGAARFPQHGREVEDLVRSADVALDTAKQRGGGTTVMFDDSMVAISAERNRFRSELIRAFDDGHFLLEYQPTFDLRSRRAVGAEALIRWNHPERGLLLPAEFVGFAERYGLGGRLSRWVLDRICDDIGAFDLPSNFRCFFNLPAHMLDDAAFLSDLEEQLGKMPHLAKHLGIEITESEAMRDAERTVQALQNIRDFGLRIAIDDFGTGYSSMAYLKRLPVDVIKIDRSFVSGLPNDEKDAALVEMFLQLSRQFGFVSLAEGIELDDQADWLSAHGCALGQGFLVSRSLPRETFAKLLLGSQASEALR